MTNANRIKTYAPRRTQRDIVITQGIHVSAYGNKQRVKRVIFNEVIG